MWSARPGPAAVRPHPDLSLCVSALLRPAPRRRRRRGRRAQGPDGPQQHRHHHGLLQGHLETETGSGRKRCAHSSSTAPERRLPQPQPPPTSCGRSLSLTVTASNRPTSKPADRLVRSGFNARAAVSTGPTPPTPGDRRPHPLAQATVKKPWPWTADNFVVRNLSDQIKRLQARPHQMREQLRRHACRGTTGDRGGQHRVTEIARQPRTTTTP